jgi:phenylacetate-coenzyme A ligase PaaK-like adenylate-forming protein
MNKFLFNVYQFLKYKKKRYPISPSRLSKRLRKSQYWSRAKTEEFQLAKLNDLLIFSKKYSTYYSKIFRYIDLLLSSLSDFKNIIPIIKKSDIIQNLEGLKTTKFTNKYLHSTSGSLGDPLTTYISGRSDAYRKANVLRFNNSWGIKIK